MSRNVFRQFDNFQLFCILLRTNCKWVKVQPLHVQIVCMSFFYNHIKLLSYIDEHLIFSDHT